MDDAWRDIRYCSQPLIFHISDKYVYKDQYATMPLTIREGVELFHLAFLGELATKLDRNLYAVKGGCNLRFFFHSIRYSEDLDIDLEVAGKGTLQRKVDRLLASQSLRRTLGARAIAITSSSTPKQTETTQRWKLGLTVAGVATHTKIEFSRRGLNEGVEFGAVDRGLTSTYGLTRTLLSHYGRKAAIEQKLGALVGRQHTQARDVFDLDVLLGSSRAADLRDLDPDLRAIAKERAMSVDFDMFRAQVLAFLPVEQQQQYDSAEVWEEIVLHVVDALSTRGEA